MLTIRSVVARFVPAALVIITALLLAMAEVQRLAGQYLSHTGRTFSIGDAIGFGALTSTSQWSDWSSAKDAGGPFRLVQVHTALDIAFVVLYVALAAFVIGFSVPSTGSAAVVMRARGHRIRLFIMLGVLVLAEAGEDTLLFICASRMSAAGFPHGIALASAIFSTLKWVAVLLLIVGMLRAPLLRRHLLGWLGRAGHAIYAQRLSAIVVAVFAVLSIVPVGLILEQVPDVERAWFDYLWLHKGGGLVQAGSALALLQIFSVTLFVIGRKRAEAYYRRDVLGLTYLGYPRQYGPDVPPYRWWPKGFYFGWFGLPALAILVGGIACLIDHRLVDAAPFWLFLGITAGLPAVSLAIEGIWRWRSLRSPSPPADPPPLVGNDNIRRIAIAGDTLSFLLMIVALLGLLRTVTPYLVLALAHPESLETSTGGSAAEYLWVFWLVAIAAVVIAAALSLLPQLTAPASDAQPADVSDADGSAAEKLVARVGAELNPFRTAKPGAREFTPLAVAVIVVAGVVSTATLTFAVVAPTELGLVIGPIGVAIAVLGSWTTLIGLAVLGLRRRRPLALFEGLGFRSDPIIVAFLVIPVVLGQLSGATALHSVDQTASANPHRDSLEKAFNAWADEDLIPDPKTGVESHACARAVRDESGDPIEGLTERPLVLVAAEGGGIRAATWTAVTLAELSDAGACAARSVFLSSGASGGSLGLALATNADRRSDQDAPLQDSDAQAIAAQLRTDIQAVGRSTALSSGLSGLMISDPIASTTGIRLPNINSGGDWRDRASLIEQSWRDAVPALDRPYDAHPQAPAGAVVMNSTDLLTQCRVSISQVVLDGALRPAGDPPSADDPGLDVKGSAGDCKHGTDEPALTIDLLGLFKTGCPYDADWATSAMLSARFPVVTPAGGIEREATADCEAVHLQLVDGGYAENSALGLLADTSARLSEIVREHNSQLSPGEPLIVPYLMYIQNSPGGYIDLPPKSDTPQLVVPLAGIATKAQQLAASSWIQRIMTAYQPVCDEDAALAGGPCAMLPDSADGISSSERTIVVAVDTEPSTSLPLGWALSDVTYTRLKTDAHSQATGDCRASGASCLAALIAAVR